MIYIKPNNYDGFDVHYIPFDEVYGLGKTEEELLQEGYLVESIPEPEVIEGKAPVMKYDPATNTVYYEYVDIPPAPKTAEQLIADQQAEINNLTIVIADIIGGAL